MHLSQKAPAVNKLVVHQDKFQLKMSSVVNSNIKGAKNESVCHPQIFFLNSERLNLKLDIFFLF